MTPELRERLHWEPIMSYCGVVYSITCEIICLNRIGRECDKEIVKLFDI